VKKRALTAAFISVLLLSTVAGAQFLSLGRANPYRYAEEQGEVSPQYDIKPPEISIFSPKNNSAYVSNNISLAFNVSVVIPTLPELFYYYLGLSEVYYKTSWLSNNTYLDLEAIKNFIPLEIRTFSNDSYAQWKTYWAYSGYKLIPNFSINVTGVPEGAHYLEVFAVLRGSRETYQSGMTIHYGRYSLVSSSMVKFTIDKISILSPHHKTYNASDIPLFFKVHKSFTQISYSLDGQDNVMVDGNITLTGLSDGEHNVTVYATDEAGNTGASETMYFNVDTPEPFPTATAATAAGASVSIISVGLLVYFKKRKHQTEMVGSK
jgi:hypothetical protein